MVYDVNKLHVGVNDSCEPLASDGSDVHATGQLVEEPRVARLHRIPAGLSNVTQQLCQVLRGLRDVQVQISPELCRVVELEHRLGPVVGLSDVVYQLIHHSPQELPRVRVRELLVGQNV